MSILRRIKRAVRGDIDAKAAAREVMRRSCVAIADRRERDKLDELGQKPARLRAPFDSMSSTDLLSHFRSRLEPDFLAGFSPSQAAWQCQTFPRETEKLLSVAETIVRQQAWPIMGLGVRNFG